MIRLMTLALVSFLTAAVALAEPAKLDSKANITAVAALAKQGLLIIPESSANRLMAFDPLSGDLLDADFIALDPDATGTVTHALPTGDGRILVSDQTRDLVHAYSLEGDYLGVFAPIGGANMAIMDNVRGMALRPNGNLLVASAAGSNANAIVEFDASGAHLGNFVANGSGGLNAPWGILARPGFDWLVTSVNSNQILRYAENTGTSLGEFAQVSSFPQQMVQLDNGNILIANFSGSVLAGVVELSAAGALLGNYTAPGIGGFRGVYPLPNGNLLTSGTNGVHEIDRDGNLVDSKYAAGGTRFIEFLPPPPGITLQVGIGLEPDAADPDFCPTESQLTITVGTEVRWCYRVSNNTDIALGLHDLQSSRFGTIFENLELTLEPGTSEFVWQTAVITETSTETAEWTAYNSGPIDTFTASGSATVTVPDEIFADRYQTGN